MILPPPLPLLVFAWNHQWPLQREAGERRCSSEHVLHACCINPPPHDGERKEIPSIYTQFVAARHPILGNAGQLSTQGPCVCIAKSRTCRYDACCNNPDEQKKKLFEKLHTLAKLSLPNYSHRCCKVVSCVAKVEPINSRYKC